MFSTKISLSLAQYSASRIIFFKQKTAYELCGRDWSSDVCSSDLNQHINNNSHPFNRSRTLDSLQSPVNGSNGSHSSGLPTKYPYHRTNSLPRNSLTSPTQHFSFSSPNGRSHSPSPSCSSDSSSWFRATFRAPSACR